MKIEGYEHREDLYYHKEFCWVRNLGNNTVEIGLTEFYTKLAGEISYIDMPQKGDDIEKDQRIGTVETGKWIGKLVSPVSGEVMAVNDKIEDEPESVNAKPYETWMLKVKLSNPDEIKELMFGDAAIDWLKGEIAQKK